MIEDSRVQSLLRQIRSMFPNGHPDFGKMTVEELALHDRKNGDYAGDDDPLGNFHRVAQIMELYDLDPSSPADICLINALKQMDAIMSLRSRGIDGAVESLKSRARDVSVYYKIFPILLDEEQSEDDDCG